MDAARLESEAIPHTDSMFRSNFYLPASDSSDRGIKPCPVDHVLLKAVIIYNRLLPSLRSR